MSNPILLQFGNSAAADAPSLNFAMMEIYRHIRNGDTVIAVAQAFAPLSEIERERLATFAGSDGVPTPPTALLALACDQAGLRVAASDQLEPLPTLRERADIVILSPDQLSDALANQCQQHSPTLISGSPLRVALAGCGIVGGGVGDLLAAATGAFELVAVMVRDLNKSRPQSVKAATFVDNLEDLIAQKPDIIVDVLSSGDLGHTLTHAALEHGIGIVSANKQALAGHMLTFKALAKRHGAPLFYGAAVGGGAPVVEQTKASAAMGRVVSIDAVVNGTVNFILSELAEGKSIEEAVKAAQLAGFAEADPTADLSGADAVAKAKILAFDAFQQEVERPAPVEALDAAKIDEIAAKPGIWRQMTRVVLDDGQPVIDVRFAPIAADDFFYDLHGERNAARLILEDGTEIVAKGRGAGAIPTAHAMLGDLWEIYRQRDTVSSV